MKKATLIAVSALFSITLPALAESYADKSQDIQSDQQAIHKDNTAISHDNQNMRDNRASKAADKAKGDSGQQAVDSVKIESNKAALAEKKTEKDVDQRVLAHDEQQ